MATQKKKSAFEILSSIDVSGHTEQKGRFTYLSWAWAVSVLLKHFPEATWEIHEWGLEGNRQPYSQSQAGAFVQVTVTVDGVVWGFIAAPLLSMPTPVTEYSHPVL